MNIVSGEIREIYVEDGTTTARVNVRGAVLRVPIIFLPHAKVGDTVLIESGVAISIIQPETYKEDKHVLSHSGKSAGD
jgi:hydrogenase maturation factor